jgi:hypothetical protein
MMAYKRKPKHIVTSKQQVWQGQLSSETINSHRYITQILTPFQKRALLCYNGARIDSSFPGQPTGPNPFLNLEYGTDRLSRNDGKELPILAAS